MNTKKRKGGATYWKKLTYLSNEVKITFYVSLFFILLIELVFKEIPAKYYWIYKLGDIFLNLCYSVFGASVFFIVVYHLPNEERNVKSNRYIHNKLVTISGKTYDIFVDLGIFNYSGSNEKSIENLTKERIDIALKDIDFALPFRYSRVLYAQNFNEYMYFKFNAMESALLDLITCNEIIETELLGLIFELEQEFSLLKICFQQSQNSSLYSNVNYLMSWSTYSSFLYSTFKLNQRIYIIRNSKRYKSYSVSLMNEYRKEIEED